MTEEKVFKNPNREKPQAISAEDYIPEHVKMMVEAEVYKPSKDQEIAKLNEATIRKTLVSAPKRKVLSASKSTAEAPPEDLSWIANKVPNSIPNINLPKEQYITKEEVEARLLEEEALEAEVNAPISVDEVTMPKEEELKNNSDFEFSMLNIDEYVLVFKDRVVETGSADDIVAALSAILDDINEKINIGDFVVLKRVSVEAGVFVDRAKS